MKTPLRTACLLLIAGIAAGQGSAPQPILPEQLQWATPPGLPDVKGAWVLGAEKTSGTYVQRVRLGKNGRIPPHTHPDTRYSTVLSGTLHIAFGTRVDTADYVAVPAGGVYVAPAGVPHHLWARDGEVIYQEAGTGPTATVILPQAP